MHPRSKVWALFFAIIVVALTTSPAAAGKTKKKDNCLIVVITNWTNVTEVFLEYWDPAGKGQWVSVKKPFIRKNDQGKVEICGLKPNGKYRVKATAQSLDSKWQDVVFQPDSESGTQTVNITLAPIEQKRN